MQLFFKLSRFVPYDCQESIYTIDYNKLYEDGKRIILMDIDNTVIPYDVHEPSEDLVKFFQEIQKIGFKLIFISNNNRKRVSKFAYNLKVDFISQAYKPFKRGYNKAKRLAKPYQPDQIISIGDQLVTDILGSNRMGIDAILVSPLKKKTEKWYTKVNRIIETKILYKLQKYYPDVYKKIEEINHYEKSL